MKHDAEIASYVFEHARDIILVIDLETGQVLDANHAAELAYQYARDQLLGLRIFDLRVEDSRNVTDQMRVANADGVLFDTVHRRCDGSTFPVEVSSRGDQLEGRRCLFSIIRDITERKRLEAERDELLAATQRALALRDDFLMIASHELRTPVTNVSLQLQRLSRLIARGSSPAHLEPVGDAALREAGRLVTLIDTLLDAQVAKGQLELALADVDLVDLIREVVERLRVRAEAIGSEIHIDVTPPIRGRWDRLRLDQVLTNLLVNALKYGRGRPIRVEARADGTRVQIAVSDQGIGVEQRDTHRIFDKFERAVPAHYGGFGLGLFIVGQIVEAHGGCVEIESVPGAGSTFRVTL
ncbi:MAG: sensor signal transduction histidine kinase [Myxococcales bacterium]|nr:sensor signal transduction histidine kinase [Myxococcales bacterium]